LLVCGRFWCLVYTVSSPTFPAARLPNKAHLQSKKKAHQQSKKLKKAQKNFVGRVRPSEEEEEEEEEGLQASVTSDIVVLVGV